MNNGQDSQGHVTFLGIKSLPKVIIIHEGNTKMIVSVSVYVLDKETAAFYNRFLVAGPKCKG